MSHVAYGGAGYLGRGPANARPALAGPRQVVGWPWSHVVSSAEAWDQDSWKFVSVPIKRRSSGK
jgi:hypothetical protein